MKIAPTFPTEAIDKCLEGYVVLRFRIDEGGVTVLNVVESDPLGVFEAAAKKNVKVQAPYWIGKYKRGEVVTNKFTFEFGEPCDPRS